MKFSVFVSAVCALAVPATNVFAYGDHAGIRGIYSGPTSTYTCAILSDFKVSCWGGGEFSPQAAVMIGNRRTVKLTMGNAFICALLDDGSVWCWGDNTHGQLGDGTKISRGNPAPVGKTSSSPAIFDFVDIAAGDGHVCAIRKTMSGTAATNAVWCWGSNSDGQIGNFTVARGADVTTPLDVRIDDGMTNPRLEHASVVVSGNSFSCIELPGATANSMACWGDDSFGQLGNDQYWDWFSSPQTVVVPSPIVSSSRDAFEISSRTLSAGGEHACAISNGSDGSSVACWGVDREGQLSDGRIGTDSIGNVYFAQMPQAVMFPDRTPLRGVLATYSGGRSACALLTNLSAACWGYGEQGQVGDNLNESATSPIPVRGWDGNTITNFISLAAGYDHFCALAFDMNVSCWGNNDSGQLGASTWGSANTPMRVNIDETLFYGSFEGR